MNLARSVPDPVRLRWIYALQWITPRIDRYAPTALGSPIWEYDWDICCILDACRYDLLQSVVRRQSDRFNILPENVGSRRSVASMTAEWMSRTFAPRYATEKSQTAYLTGNPISAKETLKHPSFSNLPLDPAQFAYFDEAWRTEWTNEDQSSIATMPPRPLTDRTIHVWRNRDDFGTNRVITHYMQPHEPFQSRPEWFSATRDVDAFGEPEREAFTSIWSKLRDGQVKSEAVWQAYRENLEWVLEEIELLANCCDATILVTSDHGNAFGDWGIWGHPPLLPISELRTVPSFLLQGTDEREYNPTEYEASTRTNGTRRGSVARRLRDLGYSE